MNVEIARKAAQTVEAAIQLCPSTAAKVAVPSVSKFAEAIAASKDVATDTRRLAERISNVGSILIPALSENIDKDSPKGMSISALGNTVIKLAAIIIDRNSQSRLSRFLSGVPYTLRIREAEQELEYALSTVAIHLSIGNSITSTQTSVEDRDQILEALVRHREEELALVQAKAIEVREEYERFPSHTLPAVPQIFHGRSSEIHQIVQLVIPNENSQIAILGPPGMGKTSVALAVMHHPDVVKKFGSRRYFISCESADTPDVLSDIMARVLSLPQKSPLAVLKQKVAKARTPLMITLDNFETTWEPSVNRMAAETILTEMAHIPGICLVITLRGAERPLSIAWTRPMPQPLAPLDMESSKKVFADISDVDASDPNVESLIRAVDMWPLPLTLLANQAQCVSPELLLRQWNDRKTEMVTRGYAGRLTDLDVSIQISLDSERFRADPGAMELLQVLATLPDGADVEHLHNMLNMESALSSRLAVLFGVGLAMGSKSNRVYCLSPIREYIVKCAPISSDMLRLVLMYYEKKLLDWRNNEFDPISKPMKQDLVASQGNIISVLTVSMNYVETGLLPLAISTMFCAFTFYLDRASIAPFEAISQIGLPFCRKSQDAYLQAMCLYVWASSTTLGGGLTVVRQEILDLCRAIHHPSSEQKIRIHLMFLVIARHFAAEGHVGKTMEFLEDANLFPLESASLSISLQSELHKINAFQLLGMTDAWTASLDDADILIKKHHLIYDTARIYLYKARGNRRRGLILASLRYSTNMLQAFEGSQDIKFGIALAHLAHAHLMQSHIKEAVEIYSAAYLIFQEFQSGAWMSSLCLFMQDVFLLKDEFEAAESMLNKYKWERGMNLWAYHSLCRQKVESGKIESIETDLHDLEAAYVKEHNLVKQRYWVLVGDMWMQRSNPWFATTPYITAAALYCKEGRRISVAMCIQRLGDALVSGCDDLETAEACYSTALGLTKHLGIPRHQADCVVRLAYIHIATGRQGEGERYIRKAQTLFGMSEHNVGEEFCRRELMKLQSNDPHNIDFRSLPRPTFIGFDIA